MAEHRLNTRRSRSEKSVALRPTAKPIPVEGVVGTTNGILWSTPTLRQYSL